MAADLAGISLAELQKLNPGYNRWATAPDGPHALLLPKNKTDSFKLNLAQIAPKNRIKWVRYQVQPGDSLGVIAEKHHTRTGIIQSVNNLDNHLIRVGQPLLIPVASKDQEDYVFSAPQRLSRKQAVRRGSFKYKHKVKTGDSLWTIARANNVTVAQLSSWNGMAPKDTLRLGQELVIWATKSKKNQGSVVRQVHYKVRSGDSLARIGQKFKVKIKDVIRWNQLEGKKYLQPGQKLTLYVDVTQISS
jgi:membrane-bound lytic murein transglycosylase D